MTVPPQPAPPPPDPATAPDGWTRAKSILDVTIAVATLLYAFGYGAWAIYAWDRELGVPPVLQSQYLIAGVVPALIVLALFLVLRALGRLRVRLRGEPGERARRIGRVLNGAGVAVVVLGWLAGRVFHFEPFPVMFAGLALLLAGTLIAPQDRSDRWFAVGASWYLSASAALLAVVVFLLYSARLFAHLPAELGGPSPQCVTLDIDAHRVSRSTLESLSDSTSTRLDSVVVRTKPFLLLFQGDLYVLAPVDTFVRGRAFRLKADVVTAVFPDARCARSRAKA